MKINKQKLSGLVIVLVITVIGVRLIISSHAQSPFASVEAESGNLSGGAYTQTDNKASNGSSVVFDAPTKAEQLNGVVIGLDTRLSNLSNALTQVGVTPGLINTFVCWEASSGCQNLFPTSFVDSTIALGSTPMLTWQVNLSSYPTTSVLDSINNGSEDNYIKTWADAAKSSNHTIYVRLMHELNADWYPWGKVTAGVTPLSKNQLGNSTSGNYPYTNTPAMLVAAYQHVVSIFHAEGATNVQFIWNFASSGNISNINSYYPGDQYVSWPSIDGYNKSSTAPQSFYQIFSPSYNAIVSFTKRPIMIAETGTVEYSGYSVNPTSKAQWITDAYLNTIPNSFPHIKTINYFDNTGLGGTLSYQFESSPTALSAFQQVYSNQLYKLSAPSTTLTF